MLWTTDTYGMIRGVELGSSSVLAPSDNILIAQNSDEKFFEAVNIQVVKSVLFFWYYVLAIYGLYLRKFGKHSQLKLVVKGMKFE